LYTVSIFFIFMKEVTSAIALAVLGIGGIFFGFYYYAHTHISCKVEREEKKSWTKVFTNPFREKKKTVSGVYTISIKPFFGKYADKKQFRVYLGARGGKSLFTEYHHFVFPVSLPEIPEEYTLEKSKISPKIDEPFLLGKNARFVHTLTFS